MLIVQPTPSFLAPVKFNQPIDGGNTKIVEFSVRFKALPQTKVDELLRRLRQALPPLPDQGTDGAVTKLVAEPVVPLNDQEVLETVLCGFGPDVTEPDGSHFEYTPANVERLCEIYGVRAAIVRSWFEHYVGAAAKN